MPRVAPGGGSGQAAPALILWEYQVRGMCRENAADDADCAAQTSANAVCSGGEAGLGPMSSIYRRRVAASGPLEDFADSGWTTCFPEDVPGRANNPQLTFAMIREAWVKTPFAKPQLSMQPVGNTTLVTLPVFFKINWPSAGFEPSEVHETSILGHPLRIKPIFKANTYHFGDGQSAGPTNSFGGTYPDGDVTHPYPKKGTYTVHASSTYGAEISLDASPWTSVNGTVEVTGPSLDLRVVTAKNRLVDRDK